jgi:hypothetical protein
MTETKRKAISKKLRFEVFKRDSFTCQYCGRSAPDVILEIDHIKPVSEGGNNGILNLITSCIECNRGKGKRKLTDQQTLKKEKAQLDAMQKRREQMRLMMQWQDELLQAEEEEINYIEKVILDEAKQLTEKGRRGVRRCIKDFGFKEVLEAAKIARVQYIDNNERLQKLGGIAYNKKYRNKE